ncbi:MAG: ATP-binding protein [Bacteroidota bacterium]
MRILRISLSFMLIFSFLWASGQHQVRNWREIDPRSSTDAFDQYGKFLRESYQWEFEERLDFLKHVYHASKTYGNDSLIYTYSEKLGVLYREADSMSQAFILLSEAIKYSTNPRFKRTALNSMGGLHLKNKDYDAALDYYFQAVEEAKKLNDGSEAYPIGNISEVYAILDDYENAIKYLKYSIGFSHALISPEKEYSLVYDYSYISKYFLDTKQGDSTRVYLEKAIENIQKIDTVKRQKFQDACFIGSNYAANIYLELGEADKAKFYIEETRKFAQNFYYSSVLILEAQYYMLVKDYASALEILESEELERTEYSGKTGILAMQVECLKGLGEHKRAVEIQEEWIAHQEKLFGQDRLRFSAFADVKYETIRREEEIKSLLLNQEVQELTIENQRFAMILNALIALLLAGSAIYLWQRYRNRNRLSQYLQEQVDLKTQDLKKANEELRVLNFVASHDLKEPINNIRNYIGLIHTKISSESKASLSFFFEIIDNSIGQIYTLVEDLAKYLSLANDEEVETSLIDLDQLTDEVFLSLDSYVQERKGELINAGLPELYSNSSLMRVILKNLVENGLKFNQASVPRVEVSHWENPTNHLISVSDNGIGVEKEFHTRIFENFKRLHNRSEYKGTGMGLAIVKLLVEKLGGSIRLESVVGEGSTFIFSLPKRSFRYN